jgi:hypothetical protein
MGTPPAALIVDNSSDSVTVTAATNLQAYLTAAGYSPVTINSGVPGSLGTYAQIWDVRYQVALSGSDVTAYLAYLSGGGSLFLMGENDNALFAARDALIASFIGTAGGGTVTVSTTTNSADLQTVQPPFTGPNTLATVTFQAIGAFTAIGNGSKISVDAANLPGALVFPPGTLSNAPTGTLIAVLDVNFLYDPVSTSGEINFAKNLIAYLAAPTPLGPSVPTLSTWAMILLAAGLMVVGFARLRGWTTASGRMGRSGAPARC